MAELDQATMLRNAALAKKNKSASRVPATVILATVVSFLNDENQLFLAVESVMPNAKHTAIVARFRSVIIENKLDDLVYPIVNDNHVFLVKLTETEDDDQ